MMASDGERKRLTRIVTRGGDKGSTHLGDGSVRRKSDVRIDAIGHVDELNSCLGVLVSLLRDDELSVLVQEIQHRLFDLGAELAVPGRAKFDTTAIGRLDAAAETYNRALPELREFILPGGSHAAATCHLARSVCRRAERAFVRLVDAEPDVDAPELGVFLNRLSDVLFILARTMNHREGVPELFWQPGKSD